MATAPDQTAILLRLPVSLHASVTDAAASEGVSVNAYCLRAVRESLDSDLSIGKSNGTATAYEAQVSFTLTGDDADARAVQVGERLKRSAQAGGARRVATRLVRIALLKAS